MKKILLITFLFVSVLMLTSEAKQQGEYGYGAFYSRLAPYGHWMEFDNGLVVWKPNIRNSNWAPYSVGTWVWTDDGWYWDSYEPFGYITFHYGRWQFDDYYGWIWIPDYDWAPAWVEWRFDDNYIGWAPLSPYAIFDIHLGIRFSHEYHPPYNHWNFVRYNHFCDPRVNNYFENNDSKHRFFDRTRYRTEYGYNNGRVVNRSIDMDIIRERGRIDVRKRNIERTSDDRNFSNRVKSNNQNVRAFVLNRSDISRSNDKDREIITKSDRNTSFDNKNIQIGRDRNIIERDRKSTINNDKKIERNNADNNRNTDVKKNDVRRPNVQKENDQNKNEERDKKIKKNDERKISEERIQINRDTKVQQNRNNRTSIDQNVNRNNVDKRNDRRSEVITRKEQTNTKRDANTGVMQKNTNNNREKSPQRNDNQKDKDNSRNNDRQRTR